MLLKKSPNYMRRNEFSRDTFYLFHQQSAQQMGEKKRKNQTNMWRAYMWLSNLLYNMGRKQGENTNTSLYV